MREMVLLALTMALVAPSVSTASDVMFRGDAAHLGVYDSPAPTLATVRWRFHTKARIVSSPVYGNGVVYVGSNDGRLYAVNASTGAQIWKFQTKGLVNSSPAIANGVVYFAGGDGSIYAVNASTGAKRWRFKTGGEHRFYAPGIHGIVPKTEMMPDPYDMFLSSPAVANGTVYVGSSDHNVYVLNADTGSLRWKFATGNVVHASPAVANGIVYIGSWDRYMYALDASSGKLRWKFQTGDDRDTYNQVGIASSAAVANGMVYFGCRDSHLYALDAGSGKLRWSHDEHGSWVISSPAVYRDAVYYTTSDSRKFYSLDAKTGKQRFKTMFAAFAYSSPAIAGGTAYFGAFDGRLYAVSTSTGQSVGTFSTDAARANLAAVLDAHGNVDLGKFYDDPTLDGTFVALSKIFALGAIAGSPVIANGIIYIGSADGTLYALN